MDRRDFLFGAAATTTLGACATSPGMVPTVTNLPANLVDLTAVQLSSAIHAKHVSCVEVMDAYLRQIEAYNPTYTAIVSQSPREQCLRMATQADDALARGEDWGWMHGMPFAVKDLSDVEGFVTSSGSPILADNTAKTDSLLTQRIRAAGALIIAKTNVPEWGLGSQSYNSVFGTTGCAYNPDLTAGGSSGGAACALATHMMPVADGSDLMGSLRNPAAFNNVIGFRPTQGRTPSSLNADLFYRQLPTAGPMGRNTQDTIYLHTTLAGSVAERPLSLRDRVTAPQSYQPAKLPGTRIGWLKDFGGYLPTEPGMLELCESNFERLGREGVVIEPCNVSFDLSALWRAWVILRQFIVWSGLKSFYQNPATRTLLKPEAIWEIEGGASLSVEDLEFAYKTRTAWYRAVSHLFEMNDFLMLPSAQVFPFDKNTPWPSSIDGRAMDTYHRWMEVVIGGTLSGMPVVNIPAGFDHQMRPAGLQVLGPFGSDQRVLEFAWACELATQHLDRRPELVKAKHSAG